MYGTTFASYLLTCLLIYGTLQVRCREVAAVGRRCRWTGRRDQFNSHQHDYDQPAGEQCRSITRAARKRPAESYDEAPSAKAVRVDVSGTTQTSSVPAGVELNESSTVRDDTAASVAEPRQPNTNDPHHIQANDDHEDEETKPKEHKEEDWNEVIDLLHVVAADLDRRRKWGDLLFFYTDLAEAVEAVIDGADYDEVEDFVLSLIPVLYP